MVKFSVKYTNTEGEVLQEQFDESAKVKTVLATIKARFGIESGRGCQIKVEGSKQALGQKKYIGDEIKSGDILILVVGKKVVKKRGSGVPKIKFTISYNEVSKSFEEKRSKLVQNVVQTARIKFGIVSGDCRLKLNNIVLNRDSSVGDSGILENSQLELVIFRTRVQADVQRKEVMVGNFKLILASLPPHLIKVPTQMDLYAILDKMNKEERQLTEAPLKLVRYIGTAEDYIFHFDDYHCNPKSENSRRTVFNKNDHCVVLIKRFTQDSLDPRFKSPKQAAIAYELLSGLLREECSVASNWTPGVGCSDTNAKAYAKLNDNDIYELAAWMIDVIQNHD